MSFFCRLGGTKNSQILCLSTQKWSLPLNTYKGGIKRIPRQKLISWQQLISPSLSPYFHLILNCRALWEFGIFVVVGSRGGRGPREYYFAMRIWKSTSLGGFPSPFANYLQDRTHFLKVTEVSVDRSIWPRVTANRCVKASVRGDHSPTYRRPRAAAPAPSQIGAESLPPSTFRTLVLTHLTAARVAVTNNKLDMNA